MVEIALFRLDCIMDLEHTQNYPEYEVSLEHVCVFLTLSVVCLSFCFVQALGKRTALTRQIAREVVGLSPYERRILDMIKTGGSAADKRIYKFAKRRLGSHKRALRKREDIKEVNAAQRAKAAGV
eukprot:CAMPEP_0195269064 /NCGR_PEP_ID=MMETSP0706-20130129/13539_1 /TAXON_ID=33640 /ORGANISM="Asterionellopsis glacialis, Strain CCMP134" /LENGTH=124 /DNA_ID=CAMNT_0040324087 /DNA_START=246 /DNA_END=620 /DNA_ORIENTATION=-